MEILKFDNPFISFTFLDFVVVDSYFEKLENSLAPARQFATAVVLYADMVNVNCRFNRSKYLRVDE